VHPPFSDYCQSLEEFLDRFRVFEESIIQHVPDVAFHIENRANQGTSYHTNKTCTFLLASIHDILKLSEILPKKETRLKIVLDFPALLTHHYGATHLSQQMIETVFAPLSDCSMIDGMHIWGKTIGKRGTSHKGNLDTYFNHNQELKEFFLHKILTVFHDGQPRYFVPEVTSGHHDFLSIINDFQQAGFEFMSQH
jgi:hypothetical protein